MPPGRRRCAPRSPGSTQGSDSAPLNYRLSCDIHRFQSRSLETGADMTRANRLLGGKRRHGGWLPTDERALETFRTGLAAHAASRNKAALTAPVQALYDAIEGD